MKLIRSFELSLLLVCIWGLITLLITNQFSTPVILLCAGLLFASYKIRQAGWRASALIANSAAFVVFTAATIIFFTTLNLLTATVYLFLFLQVTKYSTRQTLSESRWCYLISLFHVIGASVITTTLTFGFVLVIYIFLILTSLRLFVLTQGQESTPLKLDYKFRFLLVRKLEMAGSSVAPSSDKSVHQSFPMVGSSLVLTAIVFAIASVLFGIIPRLQTQNLFQAYGPPPDEPAVSAFSENVEFGSFTEIQTDDGVALFVEPISGNRPKQIRMRGVALDTFDGKSWRRTTNVQDRGSHFQFRPALTTHLYPDIYAYNIIQPPGITNFLFADAFPMEIKVPPQYMMLVDTSAHAIHLSEMPAKEIQYKVKSMHEDLNSRKDPALNNLVDRPPSDLYQTDRGQYGGGHRPSMLFSQMGREFMDNFSRINPNRVTDTEKPAEQSSTTQTSRDDVVTGTLSGDGVSVLDRVTPEGAYAYRRRTPIERLQRYLYTCTRLPDSLSSGRVYDLAIEWTEDEETTFAKAMAIESRLKNDFAYSLTPRASGNFIENFLLEIREGHCEYFATSMAVLLRNLGIPARVVNGYYCNEWNALSKNFTVRNRDAHSWVEVWLGNDYGWMTFDPTPAGGVGRRGDHNEFAIALSRITDAIRVRWYRYVVDYSVDDQVTIVRKMMEWRRSLMRAFNNFNLLGSKFDSKTEIELGDFSREIDRRPIVVGGCAVIVILLWQAIRWIRRRRRYYLSLIRYYDDLLVLLNKRGLYMNPGQTAREFAVTVSRAHPEWLEFEAITEIYYQTRFHGKAPESKDLYRINRFRRQLQKKRSKNGSPERIRTSDQ